MTHHPCQFRFTLIGNPPGGGEKVIAYVVAGAAITETEILEYRAGRLAGHKRPKKVVFLDDLPKKAAGKVLKRELHENHK